MSKIRADGKRGLPRICRDCGERFQPNSQNNKVCWNCRLKILDRIRKTRKRCGGSNLKI